jgi:hypothetical protein
MNCGAPVNAPEVAAAQVVAEPTPASAVEPVQVVNSFGPAPEPAAPEAPVAQPAPVEPVQVAQPVVEPVAAPAVEPAAPVNTFNPGPTPVVNAAPVASPAPAKKGGAGKFVAIAIALVAVVAGVVFGFTYAKPKSGGETSPNEVKETPEETNYVTVKALGYTFQIPDNMQYEVSTDGLDIHEPDDLWQANFGVIAGSYDNIKINKNKIAENVRESGLYAGTVDVKTGGGTEFVTVEVMDANTKALFLYAAVDNSHIVAVTLLQDDGEDYVYSAIEPIGKIVKSIKTDSSKNMSVPKNSMSFKAASGIAE